MGTEIELTVGGIAIDWSKNSMGVDYRELFKKSDLTRRYSDQISYDEDRELSDRDAAYVRPLSKILPRLEILGFSLDKAKEEYNNIIIEEDTYNDHVSSEDRICFLTFEEFCEFINSHPLNELDQTYIEDLDGDVRKGKLLEEKNLIDRIPKAFLFGTSGHYSEASYFRNVVCILNPYSMLLIFGLNPENANAEVVWQYGPLVDNGWASADDFKIEERENKILLVTEGSSDTSIIKHALELLRPNIVNYFEFIDMENNYPFTGTGNLFKFAQGLKHIDVLNKIIFLLDNDTEGCIAFNKLQELEMPSNIQAILLPDLDDFSNFPTKGPDGDSHANINGRAVAIECFLDLELKNRPHARIIWSSYKKEVKKRQGALEFKESYTKHFFKSDIKSDNYNTTKLEIVLDKLLEKAIELSPTIKLDLID
ncbi:MAG: HEPN/Toprim-associated domain-containing protein [Zymomonas mobilis]|uniref:HEPN/Toprim-associated domain-containing protein n=1 Tax=Zymomonas mobilis TaxID=542 RepID=UPI0039EBBA2F